MILEDPDLFGSLDRRSVCAGRGGETFFVPEYAQLWGKWERECGVGGGSAIASGSASGEGPKPLIIAQKEYKNANNGETLFPPSLFSRASFYSFIFYLAVVRKLIMCG